MRSRRQTCVVVALVGLAAGTSTMRMVEGVAKALAFSRQGSSTTRAINGEDPTTVPRITLEDFKKLHAVQGVLPIDVRTELEFSGGRIPGAVNAPVADTSQHVKTIRALAKGRPLVFYCSCPSEHSSAEAALVLFKHGVTDVRALSGGYTEWVRSGGRIER